MRRFNEAYDRKQLIKSVIALVAFIFFCMGTRGLGFAILIPLAIGYMCTGKSQSLLTIFFISTVSVVLSNFFMPKSLLMFICQRGLLMMIAVVMMAQVFGRRNPREITPLLSLVPYLLFMAMTAQVGWAPVISYLKLVLFSVGFFAFYGVATKLLNGRVDERQLRVMMLSVASFIIFGSILTMPFPSISYMGIGELEERKINEFVSLFKGVTCHSQVLGPIVGMVGTMIFADWVFSVQKKNWLYTALLICCPILIYKTSSRTAMGSFLAGMCFVAYFASKSRVVKRSIRGKVISVAIALVMVIAVALLFSSVTRGKMANFITKSYEGNQTLTTEGVLATRQGRWEECIYNWKRSPVIGNGFQVSEDMGEKEINGIKDALSAPIEKSTWIYAILEEGGAIGMILFCLFILISLTLMIRRRAYISAALLFQMLVVNLGEFGIFAMSAEGGMFWCMVFIGAVFDHIRNNKQTGINYDQYNYK